MRGWWRCDLAWYDGPSPRRTLTLALSRPAGEGIVAVVCGTSAMSNARRRQAFIGASACPSIAAIVLTRNTRPLSRWAGEG